MGIYRGPGGTGDATNDSSSEATITVQAKDAALAAQTAAETAATNAAASATSAAASSTASINMAEGFDVSVSGLSAGSSPTSSYNNSTYLLSLGIPAGANGSNGTNGTDGRTILNGSTNPTTQGSNGDFYINTATNTLFGPKAAGAWGSGTSLVGPTGATGATGSTGATGNGIASITLTSGTHAPGTTDTYTITYTSGGTSTFTVYNGSNGSGSVASVTGTAPVVSSGGSNPAISMAKATTSVDGYLSATDWTTFNNKQAALTAGYGDTTNPYASKTANYVLAAPNGSAGSPTFRALVAADVPTLNQNTTGSAATLTTGRTIAITGDVAYTSPSFNGSANVTAAATLATVNSNTGSFGSSSSIPVITVNAKGLITGVSTETVAAATPTSVSDQANTSTGYFDLPVGTTAQRPGSPNTGMIRYNTSTSAYEVYNGSSWVQLSTAAYTYSASYLVVAGGGGGGNWAGAGAGGLLTNTATLSPGTVYTATVGAGGTAGVGGTNSTLTASGFTTVTTVGGGSAGGNGGSGSGSTNNNPAGLGTTGQGNAGGIGTTDSVSWNSGGGGGGAGAVGGTSTGAGGSSGSGGAGSASSITGTSITYAGGGGGGVDTRGPVGAGSGGAGGGGNGGGGGGNGGAGTANLGGGGGGSGYNGSFGTGGTGGSGVIILSVPTANYTGTVTGSPTVTTSGSNTIIKFTSTGTYTA